MITREHSGTPVIRTPERVKNVKTMKLYFCLSVSVALLGTISLALVAGAVGKPSGKVFGYVMSALFWLSLAAQCAVTVLWRNLRAGMIKKGARSKKLENAEIGVISFLKNREAVITDAILFASALYFASVVIFRAQSGWMIISSLCLVFLSFSLHCILNGRNYRYYKVYFNLLKEHKKDE